MAQAAVRKTDEKLRAIKEAILQLGKITLRVGIVGPGASTLEEGSSFTLAQLGLLHEFGSEDGRIPERSWFRSTLAARRTDLAALQVQVFKRVLAGELTPRAGLDVIGLQIVAWLKDAIRRGIKPELATETILRKGSTKPLIDDGQLINSIAWIVEEA